MADLKLDGIDLGGEMGGGPTGAGSMAAEPLRIHDEANLAVKSMKLVLGVGEREPLKVTKLLIGTGETESKDPTGTDSALPLSPQWLLSKPGESKPPLASVDTPRTPGSHGGANDFVSKERWRVDGNRDSEKRRDWRRPGADGDTGRRDRWREEEREGTQAGRRDRWKDAGDGNNDSRRTDRWGENTTNIRDSVDQRRPPSERWPDSSNRDGAPEPGRRDSKWSTRWGPEDKEKREKRLESEKEGDGGQHRDRHLGRTETDREADTTVRDRWRAPSIASKTKGEVPPLGSTPPKYAPGFGVGRGRGESSAIGFTAGRGRSSFSPGGVMPGLRLAIGAASVVDNSDVSQTYWYPRAKLLDIYRKRGVLSSFTEHQEGFSKVPQLTETTPFEPLAFVAPDGEEEAVLEGIRKGDIVSSGAVYSAPKESKHCEDANQSRLKGQINDGQGGGLSNFIKSISQEQDTTAMDAVSSQMGDLKGLDLLEHSDVLGEGESITDKNRRADLGHDMGELDSLMRLEDVLDLGPAQLDGSVPGNEAERLADRREVDHLAGLLDKTVTLEADKENEVLDKFISMPTKKNWELEKGTGHGDRNEALETDYNHSLPEELSLFYIDPHGEIQGPFAGADIIGWFEHGYFGTDLLVRVAGAPENSLFTELGNVMPHLKMKGLLLSGITASPNHLDDTDMIVDREIVPLELPQKAGTEHFEPGEASRSSLFLHEKDLYNGSRVIGRGLNIDKPDLHDGRRDVAGEQVVEVDMGIKQGATPSLWCNMSAFPNLEQENAELSKQSLFSQHWPAKNEFALPLAEAMPRSNGHGSPDMQIQTALWQSGMQTDPSSSPLMKDGPWHDAALEGSLLSHGLDDFRRHHLQQVEKQQLQAQAGLPFSHPLQQQQQRQQQQQHPLLELLSKQRAPVPSPLEQLHDPALLNEFNVNELHRLSPPHSSHLLPSYPYSNHQEQQANFKMPASDSLVDQLVKLQQQQQQQQHQHLHQLQHQQHPQALFEHLLRQHQQFSGANHSNVATQHLLQDNSSLDHHLEDLRGRQTILELLMQRQQEEEFQAQQHARFLQQQQSKLDERRVSGVWEVDEFGQFVRTQASTPMQVHGSLQQHHHQQPSFPQMPPPQAQKLQLEATGLHGMNLQQPKADLRTHMDFQADMRTPLDFQADRTLATLLGRGSRVDSMPSDFAQQLQGERGGFERQSSVPEYLDYLRQSEANEAGGRGWGTGSHGADMHMMEMYQGGEGLASKRANHLFKQNQFTGPNWPQDMTSVNDNFQNLTINSDFMRPPSGDNPSIGYLMQQEQQGKHTGGYRADEDFSRLLTSPPPLNQREFSGSMFYHEDPFTSNLTGSNHQVDLVGRIAHSNPQQAAWNGPTPSRVSREETDWRRAEVASQFDSLASTQPPAQAMLQGEPAGFWGTSASMIQKEPMQLPAYAHSSFDQGELARESSNDLGASGIVLSLSNTAGRNQSNLMRDSSDFAASLADEGEFMESKKNKKRNGKGKVGSVGKAASAAIPDIPMSAIGKPSKAPNMFEELASVTPPATSFGDFLSRREEQTFSQTVVPVWPTEPNTHGKAAKSLKDIQDLEKRARAEPGQIVQSQMQTLAPQPSSPIMINNNASAWQRPLLSSPSQFMGQSKLQSSPLTHSGFGAMKAGVENDGQFWDFGDAGVSKQAFRTDWQENSQPVKRDQLAMKAPVKGSETPLYQGSSGTSGTGFSAAVMRPGSEAPLYRGSSGTLGTGFSAAVMRPPSIISTSQQAEAAPQGQFSVMEARAFRQWCESQIKKFSGKGHMTLLEFCMSLPSVSEAGEYLTMYLGSEPAAEAFKAEFIRRKAMIPPEVAHVVFPMSEAVIKDELDPHEAEKRTDTPSKKVAEEEDNDFETVRSGKRKGRKGKKVVDPSLVLGFNVANSNRILMGEIQHTND